MGEHQQDAPLPDEPHIALLEAAWGVIANAGWNGDAKHPEWQEAAERWRGDYHRWLDLHLRPGGYQTWEELALGLTRERDALSVEVTVLQRALRDADGAKPLVDDKGLDVAMLRAVTAERDDALREVAKLRAEIREHGGWPEVPVRDYGVES
jgi:hypothetical protein